MTSDAAANLASSPQRLDRDCQTSKVAAEQGVPNQILLHCLQSIAECIKSTTHLINESAVGKSAVNKSRTQSEHVAASCTANVQGDESKPKVTKPVKKKPARAVSFRDSKRADSYLAPRDSIVNDLKEILDEVLAADKDTATNNNTQDKLHIRLRDALSKYKHERDQATLKLSGIPNRASSLTTPSTRNTIKSLHESKIPDSRVTDTRNVVEANGARPLTKCQTDANANADDNVDDVETPSQAIRSLQSVDGDAPLFSLVVDTNKTHTFANKLRNFGLKLRAALMEQYSGPESERKWKSIPDTRTNIVINVDRENVSHKEKTVMELIRCEPIMRHLNEILDYNATGKSNRLTHEDRAKAKDICQAHVLETLFRSTMRLLADEVVATGKRTTNNQIERKKWLRKLTNILHCVANGKLEQLNSKDRAFVQRHGRVEIARTITSLLKCIDEAEHQTVE